MVKPYSLSRSHCPLRPRRCGLLRREPSPRRQPNLPRRSRRRRAESHLLPPRSPPLVVRPTFPMAVIRSERVRTSGAEGTGPMTERKPAAGTVTTSAMVDGVRTADRTQIRHCGSRRVGGHLTLVGVASGCVLGLTANITVVNQEELSTNHCRTCRRASCKRDFTVPNGRSSRSAISSYSSWQMSR